MTTDLVGQRRVTEIGPPEIVDRGRHTVAAVLGTSALLAVIVFGVVGLGALLAGDDGREVDQVVLPRLSGRALADAQAEVERLGLVVDLRYEPNEILAPDVVVEHEPIAGARLEVGEQVVLVVSDGPAGVTVPDLSGLGSAEAVRLLSVIGLVGVPVVAFDERVPQFEVIGSVPAAGARSVAGTEVQIRVSDGPEPRTVPDMIGRASPEAFAMLGRADLEVGGVSFRYSPGSEPGTVLATSPDAGQAIPRGAPVRVQVATADRAGRIPDLVGLTRSSAEQLARSLGLTLSVRAEVVSPGDNRNGLVISQSLVANSPISSTSMTAVVGAVPPPPTTTVPDSTTATTTP